MATFCDSRAKIPLLLVTLTSFVWTGEAAATPDCPEMDASANVATDQPRPWKPGIAVTFECVAGTWLISGSLHLYCMEHGIWNETTPKCDYPCPRNPYYDSKTMKQLTPTKAGKGVPWLPGDIVQYECLSGRVLTSGSLVVQCLTTYQWNATLGVCKAKCPDFNGTSWLIAPSGPWIPGRSYKFGCKDGSVLVRGSLDLSCTMNSKWSATTPVCEAPCPDIPEASEDDSNITKELAPKKPWFSGTKIVYKCKDKFHLLSGKLEMRCNANSQWDIELPKCAAACPNLKDGNLIQNGGSPIAPHLPGHVVSYRCGEDKLATTGSLNLKCLDDSKWNGTLATCKAPCKYLTEHNLVRLAPTTPQPWPQGTNAAYECAPGKSRIGGSLYLSCGVEGAWNATIAVCKGTCPSIRMGTHEKLSNSTPSPPWFEGTVVKLECTNGAKLESGSLKLRCLENGIPTWDAKVPKCSVPCPEISGTNAKVGKSGPWFPGMSAELTCPDGTVPANGSLTLSCTSSSQWDAKPPKCIAYCPSFQFNGTVVEGPQHGPWIPGTTIALKCADGATFQTGSLVLTCKAKSDIESVWDYSPPVCYTSFFEYHSGYDDSLMLFQSTHPDYFKWRSYSFTDNTCMMFSLGSSIDAWPVNQTLVPDWPTSVASFQTKEIITPSTGDVWIRFYYRLYNSILGTLSVSRIDRDGKTFHDEILKPRDVVYGGEWRQHSYSMSSSVFNGSKLHFEATVQAKKRTTFRIDDIVVADGPWMFPESKDICPHIWDVKDYIDNGDVSKANCQGREGSRTYFRCFKMRGYKFKGTGSGIMETNCVRTKSGRTGEWVPNNGVCVLAKCGRPPKVRNATMVIIRPDPNVTKSTNPRVYHAHTTVVYKCAENYTYMSGPTMKRCTLDDAWTPGDINCQKLLPTPTPTDSTTEVTTAQGKSSETTSSPIVSTTTSTTTKTAISALNKLTLPQTQATREWKTSTKSEKEDFVSKDSTPERKVSSYEKRKLFPILPVGQISGSTQACPQITLIMCVGMVFIKCSFKC